MKAQRKAYDEADELPPLVPVAVLARIRTAVSKFNRAQATAVEELIKLKEDAAAEAVEKEQHRFALGAALQFGKRTHLSSLNHFDAHVQHSPFTKNGAMKVGKSEIKFKVNGSLVPHSILMHPPQKSRSQVRYPLNGNWTAFRASVGVPTIDEKKDPGSALTFEVLGDGESLWKSNPVTKRDTFQPCAVRVEKVKALTLRVHCAGTHDWARAVWVEPFLAE
ncbi:MAG TPA: NPCBM/NEW2 domain-containing protein [Gemmata sp.]